MGPASIARHTAFALSEADVVILVGTRTNQNSTDSWTLLPRAAKIVHIDVDGLEIGRNYPSVRVCGDARESLHHLRRCLLEMDLSERQQYRHELTRRIGLAKETARSEISKHIESCSSTDSVRPEALMQTLDALLEPGDIVVADASYSTNWISTYLTAKDDGMRFLAPRGLAGLGWGFPMALGAKIARPTARVVCVVGDGGFGHCWSELETARRNGIAVTVIVLNNSILGYEYHAEHVHYNMHSSACRFEPVDHAAIAKASGCDGHRVRSLEEFKEIVGTAIGSNTTVVIDAITDPNAHPPLSLFAAKSPVGPQYAEVGWPR